VLNKRDGAVVLSTGAGAYDAMPGAVTLDRPRDIEVTAAALASALSLSPADRRDRVRRMRAAISRMTTADWLDRQRADALAVSRGRAPACPPPAATGGEPRCG